MDKRILCVDDEESIRLLFDMELSEEGYDVDVAGSGAEALERLNGEKYDLMLLDIRMEDMTGLDLLTQIRPDHPDMPVIMVTAVRGLRDDFTVESDSKVVDYLTKPVDLNELREKVKRALAAG